jgi:hypothetical protein
MEELEGMSSASFRQGMAGPDDPEGGFFEPIWD